MEYTAREILLSILSFIKGRDATEATLFSPTYLIAKRLTIAIKKFSTYAKGDLIDIGAGSSPYEKYFLGRVKSYVTFDNPNTSAKAGSGIDIRGNFLKNHLKSSSYDFVLFTQVLEHLPDPQKAVLEIFRILRPHGLLLLSAPFIYPVHDVKGYDYFRFSEYALRTLLARNRFTIKKIIRTGTFWTTYACLTNLYFSTGLFTTSKVRKTIRVLVFPLLLVFYFLNNLICMGLDKLDNKSNDYSPNFVVLAAKKG